MLSSHKDRRLSEPFIARLRALGIVTGDNEPMRAISTAI